MIPHFNATALAVSKWSPEISLMLSWASSLAYLMDLKTFYLNGSFIPKHPIHVKNGSLVIIFSSKTADGDFDPSPAKFYSYWSLESSM